MKYVLIEEYEDGRELESAASTSWEDIQHYAKMYAQDIGMHGLVGIRVEPRKDNNK